VAVKSLRRRVRTSILVITALAVALFAVPAAVAVRSVYHSEAITALQRDATRVSAFVPETVATDRGPLALPPEFPANLTIGVYTTSGLLVRDHGPQRSAFAAAAADGRMHEQVEGADLAVSVPVPGDHGILATVRVSMPNADVTDQTLRAWAIIALLGLCVLGVAGLLARRQARQIAIPLERLTTSARALGDGDFTITPARSTITEADSLAEALGSTAGRLGDLLRRERAFSTQVSHQLRTPLTGLLLGLESALSRPDADLRQAAETALRRGEQIQITIEDLLRLARDTHQRTDPLPVPDLLDACREQWHGLFAERDRALTVTCAADLPEVHASARAVRHALDVLVGNALEHGEGRTAVAADSFADGLLIEVSDEGPGLSNPDAAFAPRTTREGTHGIGLALARSLVEAEGGRLLLRHAAPRPVFGLLLPAVGPTARPASTTSTARRSPAPS
jgi:signal transduction histidine kinase